MNELIFKCVYAIILAIVAIVATAIKKAYVKYANNEIKRNVITATVEYVEQVYKALHGEDKLNKALETASTILSEYGIAITETELLTLIEACVGEFNNVFQTAEEKV